MQRAALFLRWGLFFRRYRGVELLTREEGSGLLFWLVRESSCQQMCFSVSVWSEGGEGGGVESIVDCILDCLLCECAMIGIEMLFFFILVLVRENLCFYTIQRIINYL